MPAIYVTGDTHGDITRLMKSFPKKELTGGQEKNFVIICGDFGLIWDRFKESSTERFYLDWLESQPFTTLFIEGNHENFDRLFSEEYPVTRWHGGRVQRIRKHVMHLMRGEYYTILGKTFFTFGGASSHDIKDGVLEPDERWKIKAYERDPFKMFRINHVSWWKQELASAEEMEHGLDVLNKHNNKVDFIITHCMPQNIANFISGGAYKSDSLTQYLDKIADAVDFGHWYGGHYHINERVFVKYDILYEDIVRIV